MIDRITAILAQQGQFPRFFGIYCCGIPLVMISALTLVYFGVRWYANRERDKE
jgi:hypothetical protein